MKTNIHSTMHELDLSNPVMLNKLSHSLMYLFRFRGQDELAFLLGYPEAENNQQALTLWMTDTLKQDGWVEPDQLLEFLVSKLKRQLMHWQEVA